MHRSRGFGFITYKYSSSVDESQKHRPHVLDDKEVETKRATPREVNDIPISDVIQAPFASLNFMFFRALNATFMNRHMIDNISL